MDTDEQQSESLRDLISEHRRTFDLAEPGHPDYQSALRGVLDATMELIEFEDGIPARRDAAERATTATFVNQTGAVLTVLAVVTGLLIWFGVVPGWYLILVIPVAVIAVWMTATRATGRTHDDMLRRSRALGVGVAAAFCAGGIALAIASDNWLGGALMLSGVLLGVRCVIDLFRRHPRFSGADDDAAA